MIDAGKEGNGEEACKLVLNVLPNKAGVRDRVSNSNGAVCCSTLQIASSTEIMSDVDTQQEEEVDIF
jgi:hypothetical protein